MKKYIQPSLTVAELDTKQAVLLSTSPGSYADKDGVVLGREEEDFDGGSWGTAW